MATISKTTLVLGTPYGETGDKKIRTRSRMAVGDAAALKISRSSFYANEMPTSVMGQDQKAKKDSLPNASLCGWAKQAAWDSGGASGPERGIRGRRAPGQVTEPRKTQKLEDPVPKRPCSAFMMYLDHSVKAKIQPGDNKTVVKFAMVKDIQKKWTEDLHEQDRLRWQKFAKSASDQYKKDMEAYKERHPEYKEIKKVKKQGSKKSFSKKTSDKASGKKTTKKAKLVKVEKTAVPKEDAAAQSGDDDDELEDGAYRSEQSSDGDYLTASSGDEAPPARPGTRVSARAKSAASTAPASTSQVTKGKKSVKAPANKRKHEVLDEDADDAQPSDVDIDLTIVGRAVKYASKKDSAIDADSLGQVKAAASSSKGRKRAKIDETLPKEVAVPAAESRAKPTKQGAALLKKTPAAPAKEDAPSKKTRGSAAKGPAPSRTSRSTSVQLVDDKQAQVKSKVSVASKKGKK